MANHKIADTQANSEKIQSFTTSYLQPAWV